MDVPLEPCIKDIPSRDAIEAIVREQVGKLERVCDHLTSCRVAIETPQRRQDVGNSYRVRIDVTVQPGHLLVVRRESSKGDMHDPLEVILKDTFRAAARRLRRLSEQQQGKTKTRSNAANTAVVHRLFPEAGFRFLRRVDTRQEIHFHRNSVLHDGFDQLAVRVVVRYTMEIGKKGPQAATMQIASTPGSPVEPPDSS